MCPSCTTAHICFEPPALPEPDEEPPTLPDFGVDESILLAPHETEIQHCDFHGYKLHSEMHICEHYHIKPTSTVLEFLKQQESDMLRWQRARGKRVVITELRLLAKNAVTRSRRMLRDDAMLNECLFENESFQCVATMYHLPQREKDCNGVYRYVWRIDIVKDDANTVQEEVIENFILWQTHRSVWEHCSTEAKERSMTCMPL